MLFWAGDVWNEESDSSTSGICISTCGDGHAVFDRQGQKNDASMNNGEPLSAGEEMNPVKSIAWNLAIVCSILITSCSRSGSNSSALNNTPYTIAGNAQSGAPSLESCVGPGPKIPIKHVFLIVLENKSFDTTFAPGSNLRMLAAHGVLLTNYWGIGHNSLDNYIAMISGQAPNPVTQMDCPVFVDIRNPNEIKNRLEAATDRLFQSVEGQGGSSGSENRSEDLSPFRR